MKIVEVFPARCRNGFICVKPAENFSFLIVKSYNTQGSPHMAMR